ncbi:MAG: hypothetical protein M1827_005661 [Pycnora praestabilis]|nr:MAG: hypothetical protein M1827_005661 [Pycnora praestabilis]
MPAIMMRWSLNQSEGGAFKIAKGLIQAASGDNVQAVALMACESFGLTLPICTSTRLKVERLARPPNTSHVLKFLKAQVGYSQADCTEFLSKNEGGIRFLSLAAALCTLDLFEAAQILVALLESTANGEQIKPTLFQLKDLLQALKAKLDLADFATSVAGWEMYCSFEDPDSDEKSRGSIMQSEVPPRESIPQLVKALSNCSRIGEACYVRIVAHRSHFPWTVAFIKWFLNDPPEIQTRESDGSLGLYLPSSSSRVFLQEVDFMSGDIASYTVSVERTVPYLNSFIAESKGTLSYDRQFGTSGNWLGMVDARAWANLRIARVAGVDPEARNLVRRVVLTLAEDLVREFKVASIHRRETENNHPMERIFTGLVDPKPFPDLDFIGPFINSLFGVNDWRREFTTWAELYPLMPREVPEPISSWGPGEVMDWQSRFSRSCPGGIDPKWVRNVGRLTADILCLSLYGLDADDATFPKVAEKEQRRSIELGCFLWDWDNRSDKCIMTVKEWINRPASTSKIKAFNAPTERQSFAEWSDVAIARFYQLLYPREIPYNAIVRCGIRSIYRHALRLLGGPDDEATIIATTSSQVIYPAIYETQTITSRGFLQLNCIPGQLRWENMTFRGAVSDGLSTEAGSNGIHPERVAPVSAPPWCLPLGKELLHSSVMPSDVSWRVTVGDKVLKVGFRIRFPDSETDVYIMDPWWILDSVSFCRMTPSCNHSRNSNLPDMDEVAQVLSLSKRPLNIGRQMYWLDLPGSPTHKIEAYVYPIHGREKDRLALATRLLGAHGRLMVVHEEGCLECALRLTVQSRIGTLIC